MQFFFAVPNNDSLKFIDEQKKFKSNTYNIPKENIFDLLIVDIRNEIYSLQLSENFESKFTNKFSVENPYYFSNFRFTKSSIDKKKVELNFNLNSILNTFFDEFPDFNPNWVLSIKPNFFENYSSSLYYVYNRFPITIPLNENYITQRKLDSFLKKIRSVERLEIEDIINYQIDFISLILNNEFRNIVFYNVEVSEAFKDICTLMLDVKLLFEFSEKIEFLIDKLTNDISLNKKIHTYLSIFKVNLGLIVGYKEITKSNEFKELPSNVLTKGYFSTIYKLLLNISQIDTSLKREKFINYLKNSVQIEDNSKIIQESNFNDYFTLYFIYLSFELELSFKNSGISEILNNEIIDDDEFINNIHSAKILRQIDIVKLGISKYKITTFSKGQPWLEGKSKYKLKLFAQWLKNNRFDLFKSFKVSLINSEHYKK